MKRIKLVKQGVSVRIVLEEGRYVFLTKVGDGLILSDEEFERVKDQIVNLGDLVEIENVEISIEKEQVEKEEKVEVESGKSKKSARRRI